MNTNDKPVTDVEKVSVCLCVGNLDATAKWYQDVLGFEVVNAQDLPKYFSRVMYLRTKAVFLELVENKNFVPSRRPDPPQHCISQGISQMCIWVDRIEETLNLVKEREIEIAFPLVSSNELEVKSFFIRDNEGNLIEFSERIADEGGELGTLEVARRWFTAMAAGDIQTALSCLDVEVEWVNYKIVPGFNDAMPWIGTYHGPDQVFATFKIFTDLVQVQSETLDALVVQGEDAMGVVHEKSVVKATGLPFEIQFVQWLTVRSGKIVRWKSYTDPSPILMALRGNN
jgi:ketosteroid isomerase-like protein/catechol 2,3-dioxygenase-like lactoylglutathione lyase family enzyme